MIPSIGNQASESPYKIAILGESSVGKTSIIKIINGESFDRGEMATVGVDFVQISRVVNNTNVTLEIWDTAGQERFRALIPVYCRNVNAAFVIFDVSSEDSFEKLESWIDLFMSLGSEKRLVYIVGNKMDLEDNIKVDLEKAKRWADSKGYLFFLVSAKSGSGIMEMVDKVLENLMSVFPRREKVEDLVLNENKSQSCC